jgi:SAM-dependent methyltransferase
VANDVETNSVERRRWNDERWVSVWPKREKLTGAVTAVLFDHLGLGEGENVLDVGSGAGGATIAAARLVGGSGSVAGADISASLVDFARQRALEQRVANVSFSVVDMQSESVHGAPFDVAMSQFGVMFFDEPATAFANIRRHLVPGGRLGFACWQPPATNPWFVGPVVAPYAPAPPPPPPGKSPTGPFSLADPERVFDILASSGWKGVEHDALELVVHVDREAIDDDGQLTFLGVPESSIEQAHAAVDEHLETLTGGDGRIRASLAFQIFTATA